jgi:hypothetical protein
MRLCLLTAAAFAASVVAIVEEHASRVTSVKLVR